MFRKFIIAAGVGLALVVGTSGAAFATGTHQDDPPPNDGKCYEVDVAGHEVKVRDEIPGHEETFSDVFYRYTYINQNDDGEDKGDPPTGTPITDPGNWNLDQKPDPKDDPIGSAFQQGGGNGSWSFWVKDKVSNNDYVEHEDAEYEWVQATYREVPCDEEPGLASASWNTIAPTCNDLNGSGVLARDHATLVSATLNGEDYPSLGDFAASIHNDPAPSGSDWVLTFKADEGFLFDNGTNVLDVPFSVPTYLTAEGCNPSNLNVAQFNAGPLAPTCDVAGSFDADLTGLTLLDTDPSGKVKVYGFGADSTTRLVIGRGTPGQVDLWLVSIDRDTVFTGLSSAWAVTDGGRSATRTITLGAQLSGPVACPVRTPPVVTPPVVVPPVAAAPVPAVVVVPDPVPAAVVTEVLATDDPAQGELASTGSDGVAITLGAALLLALSGLSLTAIRRRATR
ncbi:hypothetical protein [Cellulomonas sp. Leaf395]|uniref:hypothetical protein n=1 Tax=Cellulomonas sp. Leaf395 TaxID=1736362 RepID=UPI0006F35222|nr:hypothetical protein [Cellulomonas sp. Leaf395]KQS97000.1 hypothetical protein ASG23_15460 [Cellulomonas sp. Leaf395]